MSSVPDQRRPNHDDLTHPSWERNCEIGEHGDVVHYGALVVHSGHDGTVFVSRVRADEWDDDGQTIHEAEVWIEHVGEGRSREVYRPDEAEALATLAEAQDDDEGRALAALLRELSRDD